jgi:cytochrome c oxidase assembly factor CtaG
MLLGFVSIATAQLGGIGTGTSAGVSTVEQTLCSIYNAIHSLVFVIALVLIVLGGILYAGAHMVPGDTRGKLQGYSWTMIIGGIVGIVIVLLAPWLVGLFANSSGATGFSTSLCGIGGFGGL